MKNVLLTTILALGLTGCGDGLNTSDWKTHRNEEFGFTAKYPPTWTEGGRAIDNNTGEVVSISLQGPHENGQPRALVQFFLQRNGNSQGLSIGQWYADQREKIEAAAGEDVPAGENVTVGGRPAKLMSISGQERYFITQESDILSIAYVSQESFDPIYETILSTVKFME